MREPRALTPERSSGHVLDHEHRRLVGVVIAHTDHAQRLVPEVDRLTRENPVLSSASVLADLTHAADYEVGVHVEGDFVRHSRRR